MKICNTIVSVLILLYVNRSIDSPNSQSSMRHSDSVVGFSSSKPRCNYEALCSIKTYQFAACNQVQKNIRHALSLYNHISAKFSLCQNFIFHGHMQSNLILLTMHNTCYVTSN